ncbi:MAG: arginyl-tRNA synthetase [Sulfuricurvum sp. PC08-66]|nr:MAG: arginyl-tRNA synthetase [Sulfuricurvum sp. PC08-66]
MKDKVTSLLRHHIEGDIVLEKPKERSFGHFATPAAFGLAKILRKSPIVIAQDLAAQLSHVEAFSSVEAVSGYINIRLSDAFLEEYASWAITHEAQFAKGIKEGKILLEFVSANPTGPLHIGHARGAIYGDTLLRLGRHLGYEMTAEYYINDAGNQMDLLGTSIMLEAKSTLLGQEVVYPESFYRGEYMTDLAKEAMAEFGAEVFVEANQMMLAQWGKERVMKLIIDTLASANIHFDTFVSEASLYGDWERVLAKLQANDAIAMVEEKLWLKSTLKGDEKDRVVVRENGKPTYLAGDLIYHNQKFERNYDQYINIWGADHHGYIARVKAAVDFMGFDSSKLEVLLSQMVSLLKEGEPYKMSKRKGNVILMSDILEEIGADALRFIFASKKSDTSLEFDIETLKKEDASNPAFYINYAHARIQTLLGKSTYSIEQIMQASLEGVGEEGMHLLFDAMQLPEVVDGAFESREIQKLPEFLKRLAGAFHKFYGAHKIIGAPQEAQYLKLFLAVAVSLRVGLSLMGVTAKNRM